MKNCTLVIMAAGLGTRFGAGIKQLEPVGPNGEIIMDYSVYDAKAAGFDKVVFIIRKDIKDAFSQMIGDRISENIKTEFVFQETQDVPEEYKHINREKPWGTGHAVLACKGIVNEPFVVINADDYYGKEAFVKLHDYLTSDRPDNGKLDMCMAGFILKNTLSENGTVTRAVCRADKNGMLEEITETFKIRREDGKVVSGGDKTPLDEDSLVSMNMWGCPPEFIDLLESEFDAFLKTSANDSKAEFLLPVIIDKLLKSKEAQCKLLESRDKWFGVTYAEDKQSVTNSIRALINNGVYPEKLW